MKNESFEEGERQTLMKVFLKFVETENHMTKNYIFISYIMQSRT